MTFDLAAVRLTRRKVNAGIWTCATITMLASAISGITAFYYLQKDGWGIASGAMTALAVDVALWVVLTGDHLLETIGVPAGSWARALRWGTAAMSVVLNTLAAAVADIPTAPKVPLIIVHAFVPLVMVALAEYRGECARAIAPRELAVLVEIEAQRQAADTPIATASERISTTSTPLETSTAALPAPQPQLQRSPTTGHPTVTPFPLRSTDSAGPGRSQPASAHKLRTPPVARSSQSPTLAAGRPSPIRDRAFAWLARHHGPDTTATILAAAIDGSPHTCKKLLGEWRKQQQEVAS